MKHTNLLFLKKHGFNVPRFTVVKDVEKYNEDFSQAKFFAVRSSFSSEDNGQASFAGQYDSYLNVPREQVKEKIQAVLDCGKKKNVQEYKLFKKIRHREQGYAIVQEMVQASHAGVIFTANPIGILNEMVVVVGKGIGENVVNDKVKTTSYFYNVDDDIYYHVRQDDSQLLKESTFKELIQEAKRIKEVFGRDMDIEYAIKNDRIYILQARPITTLDKNKQIILDNSNIVESYPGISLPLTQDFVKTIYHEIFQSALERLTKDKTLVNAMDKYLQNMVDTANWRMYYRISNWYSVLNLLPFSNLIIPMWQKMLGVTNTTVNCAKDIKIQFFTKCIIIKSCLEYLFKTPEMMEKLNKSFKEKYEKYQREIEHANTSEELLNIYKKIKKDIMKDWDITLFNDMYAFIFTALSGKRNRAAISNIKNLESMKPVKSIDKIVETAREYGMNSRQYRMESRRHIMMYGDRCLGELKLETKTYRTNPEMLDEYVRKQLKEPYKPRSIHVAKDSKNVFVKKAKIGIENREISRMNRSRIFGIARSIFLKIGAIFCEKGYLEKPEDVFYLYMNELEKPKKYKSVVIQRKRDRKMYEQVPSYSRLVFDGAIINKTGQISQATVLTMPDELSGAGTSMGTVQGEVLVVNEPSDSIDTTGKILVTRSTDPGWVFLVKNAIGIIAEKGSLLSHTAIISRELHKPAVVNVKDCTCLLHSGDIVELNAETGMIRIIEKAK